MRTLIILAALFTASCTITEPPTCNDGMDNDGDGLVDMADPGCTSRSDNSERNYWHQCNDGIDNDGDGRTDMDDKGCDSREDDDEYNCIPELTELGYCPINQEYEGVYKVTKRGGWDCDCSQEELEEWKDTGVAPECCVWKESNVQGYMNITPRSKDVGVILVHVNDNIFYGQYEIQENYWYIRRAYTKYQGPLYYIIEVNNDTFTFSTAYSPPYIDFYSDEQPEDYHVIFTVKSERIGDVGTCFDDTQTETFNYCHRGPICKKLLAGCTTKVICANLANDLSYMYGSWGDEESCDSSFNDIMDFWRYY